MIAEAEGRTSEARTFWREARALYSAAGALDEAGEAERHEAALGRDFGRER